MCFINAARLHLFNWMNNVYTVRHTIYTATFCVGMNAATSVKYELQAHHIMNDGLCTQCGTIVVYINVKCELTIVCRNKHWQIVVIIHSICAQAIFIGFTYETTQLCFRMHTSYWSFRREFYAHTLTNISMLGNNYMSPFCLISNFITRINYTVTL